MESNYKINGVVIKRPSKFKIERYKLSNSTRLANGDMSATLIANKRKFYFTYDAIESDKLNEILELIWEGDFFFTLTYVDNNVEKTATVYVGSIPSVLHHTGSKWVWKDVSFDLIER